MSPSTRITYLAVICCPFPFGCLSLYYFITSVSVFSRVQEEVSTDGDVYNEAYNDAYNLSVLYAKLAILCGGILIVVLFLSFLFSYQMIQYSLLSISSAFTPRNDTIARDLLRSYYSK